MYKVFIYGAGGKVSGTYFAAISDLGWKVVGACDAEKKRTKVLKRAESRGFDDVKFFDIGDDRDWSRIGNIDLFIIATPPSSHLSVLEDVPEGSKVLCEKPIVDREEEIEKIKKLIGEKDILFGVHHELRVHYPFIKAKEFINRNKDEIKYVKMYNLSTPLSKEWRSSDIEYYLVMDKMIHLIDLLYWWGFSPKHIEYKDVVIDSTGLSYVEVILNDGGEIKFNLRSTWYMGSAKKKISFLQGFEIYAKSGIYRYFLFNRKEYIGVEYMDKKPPQNEEMEWVGFKGMFKHSLKTFMDDPSIFSIESAVNAVKLGSIIVGCRRGG